MKTAVLAAFLLFGKVEDLVTSTHVFGGASHGGTADFLLLGAYGSLVLIGAAVFVFAASLHLADRKRRA